MDRDPEGCSQPDGHCRGEREQLFFENHYGAYKEKLLREQ